MRGRSARPNCGYDESAEHTVSVPVWQLSISDGTAVTDLLTGNAYTAAGCDVTVSVAPHFGVVLEQ